MTAFQEAWVNSNSMNQSIAAFETLKTTYPALKRFLDTSGLDDVVQMRAVFDHKQGSIASHKIAKEMYKAYDAQWGNDKLQRTVRDNLKKYFENTKNLLDNFAKYSILDKPELSSAVNNAIESIDGKIKTLNIPATVLFSQLSGFRWAHELPAGRAVVWTPQKLPDGRYLTLAFEPGAECFNVVIFSVPKQIVPQQVMTDTGVTLSQVWWEVGAIGSVRQSEFSILWVVPKKKPEPVEKPKGANNSAADWQKKDVPADQEPTGPQVDVENPPVIGPKPPPSIEQSVDTEAVTGTSTVVEKSAVDPDAP